MMKEDQYAITSEKDYTLFKFVSTGPKGNISKLVQYQPMEIKGIYNLAFGDKTSDLDDFNDKIISDNGDREKVLATVAATIYAFTKETPDAIIYAEGSTKARTRLYQIGIAKFIEEIIEDFEVYGQAGDEWQPFAKGVNYTAFLFKKKMSKFVL